MLINSIKIIQSIANVATSLTDDIMGTCETLLTLVPRYEYFKLILNMYTFIILIIKLINYNYF